MYNHSELANQEHKDWKKEVRSMSVLAFLFSFVTLGFIIIDRRANAEYRQNRGGIVVIRRDGTTVIG